MKRVTVSTPFDEAIEYIAIETVDDVNDYAESLQVKVDNAVTRLVTSKVPVDRWDHMVTRDDQGGVMAAAVTTANVRGTNPLYEVGPLFEAKIQSFLGYIAQGRTVLVNDSGGFCYLTPDYHTIIGEVDYTAPPKFQYKINEGTRYLNLENDPDLEDNAVNYLKRQDTNYSWVTNLHAVSEGDLLDIMAEFREAGGQVVYVYTTATNVPQMYEYCRCIIDSSITRVQFKFSAGKPEKEVRDVIRYLEDAGVDVEVL